MCSLFSWQHAISYLLLSAYMILCKGKYWFFEWFHSKNFEFFVFFPQHVIYREKVIKREKCNYKISVCHTPPPRRVQFFLHSYSLDHKT
jgi:hypothetical protein